MKYTLGRVGTPIPRILNPLVMLFVAFILAIVAVMMVVGAVVCLAVAPFSFLTVLRIKESK